MTLQESTRSPRERLFREALETIEYRLATRADAPEIATLFLTFFNEAHYQDRGIVYSIERATDWLANVIGHGTVPHMAAVHEGEIVGAVSYSLDDTFCVEPVAVMHMLYVAKAYRRSAIGRTLVALVTDMAKGDGACAFHAPIASGMGEQRSLVNLFAHGGFEPVGVIMGRAL